MAWLFSLVRGGKQNLYAVPHRRGDIGLGGRSHRDDGTTIGEKQVDRVGVFAEGLGGADRVLVMYGGQVVEHAPVKDLFANPQHPYTSALLKTIPKISGDRETRLKVIEGQPPIMLGAPNACPFRARCEYRHDACDAANPARRAVDAAPVGQGHDVACHWHAPAAQEVAHA